MKYVHKIKIDDRVGPGGEYKSYTEYLKSLKKMEPEFREILHPEMEMHKVFSYLTMKSDIEALEEYYKICLKSDSIYTSLVKK